MMRDPRGQDANSVTIAADELKKEGRQFMVVAWIVAGMPALIGVVALATHFYHLSLIKAFDSYQTTSGTVVRSDVRTISGSGRMVNSTLTLKLNYRYEVNGVEYNGQFLSPQQVGMSIDEDLVEPFHRQFPVGMAVQVHFDREHPDRAYLLRSTGSNRPTLVIGLILCAVAVGMVIGADRLRRLILKS